MSPRGTNHTVNSMDVMMCILTPTVHCSGPLRPHPEHASSSKSVAVWEYSGLWLAHGAGRQGILVTIERDDEHAKIARDHFKAEGLSDQIKILLGLGASILPSLQDVYDLIYFDTDPAESLIDLEQFERLLSPGGLLVSANLFLGQYAPDLPGLDKTAEYRLRILDSDRWLTAYLPDGTALSIRR
jgi:predicted O-methyltransferase YrrM